MAPLASAQLPDNAPHLLVVDDDRRIRDLLSRFLRTEGYRVTTADTAADARAKLDGLSFDLLILDVTMPGETGFEFAKSLLDKSYAGLETKLNDLAGIVLPGQQRRLD